MTILFVDDDTTFRQTYGRLLGLQLGHPVELADTAEAGLAIAEPYALIVTDLIMPGTGGLEFLRRLRQDPARVTLSGKGVTANNRCTRWRWGTSGWGRRR